MTKILYRNKEYDAALKQFELNFKPADKNAELVEDDDGSWIIRAKKMMTKVPQVVDKS